MQKIIFFIAFLCLAHFAKAQDSTKQKTQVDDRVFTFVEQKPEFPGGEKELMGYFDDNIKYPQDALDADVKGKVFLSFIIDRDSSIRNVKVIRGFFPSCDAEALRVCSAMPKWIPGRQKGQNVNVQYTMPVLFAFDDKKQKKRLVPFNERIRPIPTIDKIGTNSIVPPRPILNPEAPEADQIRTFVEQKPEFANGGDQGLKKYLQENVKIPAAAAEVSGKVYMQFVVEKDGSLSNIKVVRGLGYGCDEEAMRVITAMPQWFPAKHKGKEVRCMYTLPVPFGFMDKK
jgi:TonB family protein